MNYPKYITYGATHYYNCNDRITHQAWCSGRVMCEAFKSEKKALAKARSIAQATKAEYMNRGIRAQVVKVDPQWHGGKA